MSPRASSCRAGGADVRVRVDGADAPSEVAGDYAFVWVGSGAHSLTTC
jgi:hypothetical protein